MTKTEKKYESFRVNTDSVESFAVKYADEHKVLDSNLGTKGKLVHGSVKINACMEGCDVGGIFGNADNLEDALLNAEKQSGVKLTDPDIREKYKLEITGYFEFEYKVPVVKKKSKGIGPGPVGGNYKTFSEYF